MLPRIANPASLPAEPLITAVTLAELSVSRSWLMMTQQQLRSLQAAVADTTQGGITFDQLVTVGGWELKFGAPRADGLLPALIHARLIG